VLDPAADGLTTEEKEAQLRILTQERGSSYVFLIRQPLFEQLGMLATETKASINAVITAALELLFFSIDSHGKKLFAMALAARYLPGFAGLLGYLGGGAYMYGRVDAGSSVTTLIKEAYTDFLKAAMHIIYDHIEMGLDEPALRARVDVNINYQNKAIVERNLLPERRHQFFKLHDAPIYYTLNVITWEFENGLLLDWQHNTGIYSQDAISCLTDKFVRLLALMCQFPDITVMELLDRRRLCDQS
jgi:hypothetical protein